MARPILHVELTLKRTEAMMRYRVTYNDQYLFHVMAMDAPDARAEARHVARRTMRSEVVNGLEVSLDN
jgi:hypothetical protein